MKSLSHMLNFRVLLSLLVFSLSLTACQQDTKETVVIYTSVDRHYSEPILKEFEKKTGIVVDALYDIEAAKTIGLVNKLIAEGSRPRADVFWNGEFLLTQLLADRGILQRYQTKGKEAGQTQDQGQLWTSFGGRARVLIVNNKKVAEAERPTSLLDFTSDRWSGNELAVAHPLFGTSATHAKALYTKWGAEKAETFFTKLKQRGVQFVSGNSVVRDLAVRGKISFGITDTDDACSAVAKGADVSVIFPDQEPDGLGTLTIPNTVALVSNGPNSEAGKKLIDYLLSDEVRSNLAKAGWFHVEGDKVSPTLNCGLPTTVNAMEVKPQEMFKIQQRATDTLRALLAK